MEGLWVWCTAVRGERLQRVGGGGLHHQPAVVRSHLPQCPPPVVKAERGELPDEELQGERVGSWGQEAWWWWQGGLVVSRGRSMDRKEQDLREAGTRMQKGLEAG